MAWFQPASLAPLHQFELLGLLFSLALYNGITLPVTFPLALYRRLLGQPVTSIRHIEDGWPELAKGFEELLSWSDGNVGDVFVRDYAFSFETMGQTVDVDMKAFARDDAWPAHAVKFVPCEHGVGCESSFPVLHGTQMHITFDAEDNPPLDDVRWRRPMRLDESAALYEDFDDDVFADVLESITGGKEARLMVGSWRKRHNQTWPWTKRDGADLVTDGNREEFVSDYIFWLTYKSVERQYEAFAKGFHACLDMKALSVSIPAPSPPPPASLLPPIKSHEYPPTSTSEHQP